MLGSLSSVARHIPGSVDLTLDNRERERGRRYIFPQHIPFMLLILSCECICRGQCICTDSLLATWMDSICCYMEGVLIYHYNPLHTWKEYGSESPKCRTARLLTAFPAAPLVVSCSSKRAQMEDSLSDHDDSIHRTTFKKRYPQFAGWLISWLWLKIHL